MRGCLALVVVLAAATTMSLVGVSAEVGVAASVGEKPGCDAEIQLAKNYADLQEWKDAEIHFAASAKDAQCQQESLAGIRAARIAQDARLLETGQVYESAHQWSGAEDVYRAAASDAAVGGVTRKIAEERLKAVLKAEHEEKKWSERRDVVTEWVKDVAAVLVFLLSFVLLIFTVRSLWRGRRVILIHPFDAPTDELSKGLNIQLRYARTTMNNPAFSGAAQMPAYLVENLKFSDEVEPIQDLEIAGTNIPFAALGKLFGRPRVRVTGGFDGVAPIGNAYSIVETVGSESAFIRREIRVGVPNQQRLDLLDFAYDVIVEASSAYGDI